MRWEEAVTRKWNEVRWERIDYQKISFYLTFYPSTFWFFWLMISFFCSLTFLANLRAPCKGFSFEFSIPFFFPLPKSFGEIPFSILLFSINLEFNLAFSMIIFNSLDNFEFKLPFKILFNWISIGMKSSGKPKFSELTVKKNNNKWQVSSVKMSE